MKIAKPYTVRHIKDRVKIIINTIDLILNLDLRGKCPYKSKGYYGQKAVRDDLEMAKSYLQNIIGKKNNTPDINEMIPPRTMKSIRMGWHDLSNPKVKGE